MTAGREQKAPGDRRLGNAALGKMVIVSMGPQATIVRRLASSRIGRWVFLSQRAHPYGWWIFALASGAVMAAVLWVAVSHLLAVAFGVFIAIEATIVLGLRLVQRRLLRRGPTQST